MNLLTIYHMQRSGGHMLAKWFLDMLYPPKLFLNDLVQAVMNDSAAFLPPRCTLPQMRNVVIGLEDSPIAMAKSNLDWAWRRFGLPTPGKDVSVVLVRSLTNMLASRLFFKHELKQGAATQEAVSTWINHATAVIEGEHFRTGRVVGVYYDLLVSSVDYQKSVARQMDFVYYPLPGSEVLGQGSSFDGGSVLERHKRIPHGILNALDLTQAIDVQLRLEEFFASPPGVGIGDLGVSW